MKRLIVLLVLAMGLAGVIFPAPTSARTLETSCERQRTATVVGSEDAFAGEGSWAAWSLAGWHVEKVLRASGERPSRTVEEGGYFVYSSFTPATPNAPRSVYTVVWAWLPETFSAVINLSRAATTFTAASATVSVWYDRDFDLDPAPAPDSKTVVTVSVRGHWRGGGRIEVQRATDRTVDNGVATVERRALLTRGAQSRLLVTDSSGATWMDGWYGDAMLSDTETVRTISTTARH